MPPASPSHQPAHLNLWRRFHVAVERDAERLSRLLADRPDIGPRELTTWWDHFGPAVMRCCRFAADLYRSVGAAGAAGGSVPPSTPLRDTIGLMEVAVGVGPGSSTLAGTIDAPGRAALALRARDSARRHEAASVSLLTAALTPDAYRAWERRAIGGLTYRNVAFLAPWLLDGMTTADRDALRENVPHLRTMRCDVAAWERRYDHVAAAFA